MLDLPGGWLDMSSAPKDGTDIRAYFPLEGLADDWEREKDVYWSKTFDKWIWSGRAARGYSKEYAPSRWKPIT